MDRIAARNGNCDLFENDAGFDPCEWTPKEICHGSTTEQCTCSGILYLVWAACDACSPNPINTTWDDYSNQIFDCSGLPQQFPLPFPTGEEAFPSWAFSMASATPEPTIFDLAAASALVLGPSSTPAGPPTTSTLDQPPTIAKTSSTSTPVPTSTGTTSLSPTTSARSINSSAFFPSTVLSSPQGMTPSHGPTVQSSPSITVSVSSGNTVPPISTSSQQDQLSAHKNSFSAGAIASIVIGICLMIALAVFYLYLRRRRRQGAYDVSPLPITSPYADTSGPSNIEAWDSDAQINTTQRTAYPVPLPSTTTSPDTPSVPFNASAWNGPEAPLISTGRRHLKTESRAAQEKIHLNEGWDSSTSFAPASYPAGINARVLSTFSALSTGAAAPDPDVVLQLRAMTARVRELEAQIESPQVYESSATPPPGYSGDGRSSMRISGQS